VSTTITGTLVELRDRFLVLEGPTYINVPPDLTVDDAWLRPSPSNFTML